MGQTQSGLGITEEESAVAVPERAPRVALKLRPITAATLVVIALGLLARGQYLWLVHRFDDGVPWIFGGLLAAVVARRLCAGRRAPRPRRFGLVDWAVVAVLTLAAGAIRFPALESLPPGGFFDEAQNAIVGREILSGQRPVFIAGLTQMPALFFYLVAAALALGGDDIVSVRGLAAFLGTLAVPVFYLLVRRVSSWPVAVAAAVLMAGSRWHITFSRVGFTGIFNPLLELLAAFFLLRALETGRWRHFVGLGVVVGVGLQTYYAFNLFPVVLMAILAVRFFARGMTRPRWTRVAAGLGVAVLVAAVVLAPLLTFAVREPQTFFQRTSTVGIWNPMHNLDFWPTLRAHVQYHLQMFNYIGDVNGRHNIPDAPQLGPIAGVLFLLGMAATLARPLSWPGAAWLVWWIVMLLPGILTIEAPQAYRTIGIIPAVYLVSAQGLQLVVDLVRGVRARWVRRTVYACVVAAAIGAAAQDVECYFERQAPGQAAWDAHDADQTESARFTLAQMERYSVWVDPLHTGPTFRFRVPSGDFQPFVASQHFPLDAKTVPPGREGAAYVLQDYAADLEPVFRAMYPHAEVVQHRDPFGRVSFVSALVPMDDLQRAGDSPLAQAGLTAAFYANPSWDGPPALVRRDPTVLFHYHAEPLSDPFTVDWSARLRTEVAGEYLFQVAASGPHVLLVDGATVVSQTDSPPDLRIVHGRVQLTAGSHLLVLRYRENSYLSAIRLWWTPPSGQRSVLPMAALRPLPYPEYEALRARLPKP
jgi:hypothetical protein